MPTLEQEDTMKTITELTIAAVVVAFLVVAAVEIDHAQAGASIGLSAGWGLRF
jgi:hypothetical protein